MVFLNIMKIPPGMLSQVVLTYNKALIFIDYIINVRINLYRDSQKTKNILSLLLYYLSNSSKHH